MSMIKNSKMLNTLILLSFVFSPFTTPQVSARDLLDDGSVYFLNASGQCLKHMYPNLPADRIVAVDAKFCNVSRLSSSSATSAGGGGAGAGGGGGGGTYSSTTYRTYTRRTAQDDLDTLAALCGGDLDQYASDNGDHITQLTTDTKAEEIEFKDLKAADDKAVNEMNTACHNTCIKLAFGKVDGATECGIATAEDHQALCESLTAKDVDNTNAKLQELIKADNGSTGTGDTTTYSVQPRKAGPVSKGDWYVAADGSYKQFQRDYKTPAELKSLTDQGLNKDFPGKDPVTVKGTAGTGTGPCSKTQLATQTDNTAATVCSVVLKTKSVNWKSVTNATDLAFKDTSCMYKFDEVSEQVADKSCEAKKVAWGEVHQKYVDAIALYKSKKADLSKFADKGCKLNARVDYSTVKPDCIQKALDGCDKALAEAQIRVNNEASVSAGKFCTTCNVYGSQSKGMQAAAIISAIGGIAVPLGVSGMNYAMGMNQINQYGNNYQAYLQSCTITGAMCMSPSAGGMGYGSGGMGLGSLGLTGFGGGAGYPGMFGANLGLNMGMNTGMYPGMNQGYPGMYPGMNQGYPGMYPGMYPGAMNPMLQQGNYQQGNMNLMSVQQQMYAQQLRMAEMGGQNYAAGGGGYGYPGGGGYGYGYPSAGYGYGGGGYGYPSAGFNLNFNAGAYTSPAAYYNPAASYYGGGGGGGGCGGGIYNPAISCGAQSVCYTNMCQ